MRGCRCFPQDDRADGRAVPEYLTAHFRGIRNAKAAADIDKFYWDLRICPNPYRYAYRIISVKRRAKMHGDCHCLPADGHTGIRIRSMHRGAGAESPNNNADRTRKSRMSSVTLKNNLFLPDEG